MLENGKLWNDIDGNPIHAHGGWILKVGEYYYWYGENRSADIYVDCYRSKDLMTWEFRNHVLKVSSLCEATRVERADLKLARDPNIDYGEPCLLLVDGDDPYLRVNLERPKVLYNSKTGKYIMWMHFENGVKSKGVDNENITVKDSVLWNDCAHSMLVGPESPPEANNVFKDILFENIIVLQAQEHNPDFMGVMALMCTDNATFKDITWRNIEIERMDYGKIVFARYQTQYGQGVGKAIENIKFENIKFNGTVTLKSQILGLDKEHTVSNFVLKDFYINGRKQTSASHYFETNEFADVKFE